MNIIKPNCLSFSSNSNLLFLLLKVSSKVCNHVNQNLITYDHSLLHHHLRLLLPAQTKSLERYNITNCGKPLQRCFRFEGVFSSTTWGFLHFHGSRLVHRCVMPSRFLLSWCDQKHCQLPRLLVSRSGYLNYGKNPRGVVNWIFISLNRF